MTCLVCSALFWTHTHRTSLFTSSSADAQAMYRGNACFVSTLSVWVVGWYNSNIFASQSTDLSSQTLALSTKLFHIVSLCQKSSRSNARWARFCNFGLSQITFSSTTYSFKHGVYPISTNQLLNTDRKPWSNTVHSFDPAVSVVPGQPVPQQHASTTC